MIISKRWRPSAFTLLATALMLPAQAGAADWPMYLRDLSHSSFNPVESALTTTNVSTLAPAWTFKSGGPIASGVTISDGVVYFGNWKGDFFAVNAKDGSLLWQAFAGVAPPPQDDVCQPSIGITAQAAVDADNVYVGGGDSAVYAFNKKTGAPLWRIPLADPNSGAYIWSSLMISGRTLYVGVASLGDCPLVRGMLVRIDLDSQNTIVRYLYPEGEVGGGIWSTPAINQNTGTVFVTTGTGDQSAREGYWGGTLMALDADTLESKSYFFLPTNSLEDDIEWGSSPVLFKAADGTALVGATGKDGVLYVNRQDDLTPVWTRQLAVECIAPEQGCGSLSTPAFDGSVLYAGAGAPDDNGFGNGSLYALDPATGDQLWMRSFDGTLIAPVTVANGMVFAASTTGLKIFDAATGDSLWDDGNYSLCYGQAVVADGVVYSTYINGELVARTQTQTDPRP